PVKGNFPTVGRPMKTIHKPELFFVNPIGGSIDDVVEFSVGGDRHFLVGDQVDHKQVVVPYESDPVVVRGKCGVRLLAAIGQLFQRRGFHVIDKILCCVGSAINTFKARQQKDLGFILAELVPGYLKGGVELGAVEDCFHRLAGSYVETDDLVVV